MKKKQILFFLVIMLLILVIIYIFKDELSINKEYVENKTYRIYAVESKDLIYNISSKGTIEAKHKRTYEFSKESFEYEIKVSKGTVVNAGDILVDVTTEEDITTDITGTVIEIVESDKVIISVYDLSHLLVNFSVDQKDSNYIFLDQQIDFIYNGQIYEATIIDKSYVLKQGKLEACAELTNDGYIIVNAYVNVNIPVKLAINKIVIPKNAIKFDGFIPYVEVRTRQDQYVKRKVELGKSNGYEVEITNGLKVGDVIRIEELSSND